VKEATAGFPKESNLHGNRITIVPANKYGTNNIVRSQGRVIASLSLTSRCYSTRRTNAPEANIIKKLKDLHLRSETKKDLPIDRNVYKLMYDIDILKLAYENLKSRPGQMTPGISPETLDGISTKTLEDISKA